MLFLAILICSTSFNRCGWRYMSNSLSNTDSFPCKSTDVYSSKDLLGFIWWRIEDSLKKAWQRWVAAVVLPSYMSGYAFSKMLFFGQSIDVTSSSAVFTALNWIKSVSYLRVENFGGKYRGYSHRKFFTIWRSDLCSKIREGCMLLILQQPMIIS